MAHIFPYVYASDGSALFHIMKCKDDVLNVFVMEKTQRDRS